MESSRKSSGVSEICCYQVVSTSIVHIPKDIVTLYHFVVVFNEFPVKYDDNLTFWHADRPTNPRWDPCDSRTAVALSTKTPHSCIRSLHSNIFQTSIAEMISYTMNTSKDATAAMPSTKITTIRPRKNRFILLSAYHDSLRTTSGREEAQNENNDSECVPGLCLRESLSLRESRDFGRWGGQVRCNGYDSHIDKKAFQKLKKGCFFFRIIAVNFLSNFRGLSLLIKITRNFFFFEEV